MSITATPLERVVRVLAPGDLYEVRHATIQVPEGPGAGCKAHDMPHGLTIDELLITAREHVERLSAPGNEGVMSCPRARAAAYLAGVKAAAECIEARAFDIPAADYSDESNILLPKI